MNEEEDFFEGAFDEDKSETVDSESEEVIEKPEVDTDKVQDEETKQNSEEVIEEESLQNNDDKQVEEDRLLELESDLHNYKNRHKGSMAKLHQQSNKFKIIQDKVQDYVNKRLLSKDEAEGLFDIISIDESTLPSMDEPVINKDDNIIDKYYDVWKKNIPILNEVMDFDLAHIDAFEHFVKTSTPQEIEAIEAEFEKHEKSPIKLTKLMVELGMEHYKDVYKPLNDHGGYKGVQLAHKQEVSKYKKEIDKLNKELLKYKQEDDYIRNSKKTYTLPSEGIHNNEKPQKKSDDQWDSLVDDMYA